MGSSLALALKQSRPDVVVVGSDKDPTTLRKAVDRGVVASASADLAVVEISDMVVLAVPILVMEALLLASLAWPAHRLQKPADPAASRT